jgi:hypothetical protein
MKTPRWICSKCRQPFTRRWNANRHCNNKHYGRIEHIISFTEYIINRTDSSIPLSYSYEDNNIHQLNVKKHLFLDKSIPANNNLPFNTIADPFDDFLELELLSYKVLEPLFPKYEEMRYLLDSLPEPYKQSFLGIVLFSAINSDNPIETMDKKLRVSKIEEQ